MAGKKRAVDVERQCWSVPEVALILGISDAATYNKAKDGTIPGVFTVGRRILVNKRALEEFINGATRTSKAQGAE